jgi:hypothetical protein
MDSCLLGWGGGWGGGDWGREAGVLGGYPQPARVCHRGAGRERTLVVVFACVLWAPRRQWHLKIYNNVFIGSEATTWIMEHLQCRTRADAVAIGQRLLEAEFIHHCVRKNKKKSVSCFPFCVAGRAMAWA